LAFEHASKLLQLADNHLDIMKTPFKDNGDIDPKEIIKARVAIRRFRDQAVDNFNTFKRQAFTCVSVMKTFDSDTQTLKLMKSFISSIDDLEGKVNSFVEMCNDLEAKSFVADVVKSLESIQDQCKDIEEIMDERIKNHIQSNILATSWVDNVGNDMQMKIEEKTPLIIDLFNQRQDQLNDMIKEKSSQPGN
jgi:hypothetical protein